MLITLESEGLL